MILKVESVSACYGKVEILRGVSLEVAPGEIVCLLGRNGMGKTTLIKTIMGLTTISAGDIYYKGKKITYSHTHLIARLGISFVPENRGIFSGLSVAENLRVGTLIRQAADGRRIDDAIFEYFPILRERAGQRGGSLSGGEQQMLAIARGLVGSPDLMLIDEFSEGLQPSIVRAITEALREINQKGVSILLVEQNAKLALGLANRGYIMEKGKIVHEGDCHSLLADKALLHKHLVI